MAKTKKRKMGATHKRRKKVGAIKQDGSLEAIIGAVGGYTLARYFENSVQSLSANALAALQLAGGAALAYFPANWFLKGFGIGIAVNGADDALTSFGLLSGVGSAYDPSRALGFPSPNRVGGPVQSFPTPSAVGETASKMANMYGSIYKN